MKRTFSVLIFFFALACTVFFTSCQDVIFAKIMGEVALEDATISGRINSIVRYKMSGTEYVFIQNGRVYCKPASSQSHGDWIEKSNGLPKLEYSYYDKKFNGIYIYRLAATENTLYALGMNEKQMRQIFFWQGTMASVIGALIGIALGVAVVLLQQHFEFVMISPTLAYPVAITPLNVLIVLATIVVLGVLASLVASSRVRVK